MEKTKMSIHQGLAELKLLDSRINKANQQAIFCKVNKTTNLKIDGLSVDEFNKKVINASFNKVSDLISRRKVIKTKIVESNATTKIIVGDDTMTVAEAIERKSSILYEKQMVSNMIDQFNKAHAHVNRTNEDLVSQAEQHVLQFFNDKEADSEEVKKMNESFINSRKLEVIDPLGLRDKIENLQKSIEEFELNVDYKLSEINATTFVEV